MNFGSVNDIILGNNGLPCTTADLVVYAAGSGIDQAAVDLGVAVINDDPVNTAASTYVTRTSTAVSFTDLPGAFDGLSFEQQAHTAHGLLDPSVATAENGGGIASLSVLRATIAGSTQISETLLQGPHSQNGIIENAAGSNTYALDVGANLMPQIATAPTYSVANHAITWTENATGSATPVAELAEIDYARGSGSDSLQVSWHVAAARAGQTITYPVLPTDVASFAPTASDVVTVESLTSVKPPVGYDSVRPLVFAINDPAQLVTAAVGKAAIQEYPSLPANGLPAARTVRGHAAWHLKMGPAQKRAH